MRASLIVVLALGCSPTAHAPAPRAEPPPVAARFVGPTLATLITRDHRLVIHAGNGSPTFDVATRRGELVARQVGVDDLARTFPALHRAYRSAYAAGKGVLDARVYEAPEAPSPLGAPQFDR
jgi:hypothetical protein